MAKATKPVTGTERTQASHVPGPDWDETGERRSGEVVLPVRRTAPGYSRPHRVSAIPAEGVYPSRVLK
jgi:hypothetical protein